MQDSSGSIWYRIYLLLKDYLQESRRESLTIAEFERFLIVTPGFSLEIETTLEDVQEMMISLGYIDVCDDEIYVCDPKSFAPWTPVRKRFVRVCPACIACPSLRLIDHLTFNCEQTNTLISRANALTDGVFPESCPLETTDEPTNLKFHGVPKPKGD